jgi:hypothetical protein
MATHSERADELAAQAYRELQNALGAEQAAREGRASALAAGPAWDRLRAIQAQAQIHATLALSDTIYSRGGL